MNELAKEYQSWLKENQNFILHLRSHDSSLYTRLMPIYEVLNHLLFEFEEESQDITEDVIKIFQVGMEYLHSQVYTCKLYLENTFKNDFHHFMEYDRVIGYLLYIEDLRYELEEHQLESDTTELNKLVDYLENLMNNKEEIPDSLNLYVDAKVSKLLDKTLDFHSIIDIFVEIAETLGIDLYYESEYMIGKDI